MKKEHWKYLSLSLSIISVILLVYSMVLPMVTGLNITKVPMGYINKDSSAEDVLTKPNNGMTISIIPIDIAMTGTGLEQIQDKATSSVYVSSSYKWGQRIQFGNGEHRNINGFYLGIARVGLPAQPIYISIEDGFGNYHTWTPIPSEALPEEEQVYWVGGMFESNPYYYDYPVVYCKSDDDHTDGDFWLWAYSNENPYPDGNMVIWDSHEHEWDDSPDGLDGFDQWDGTFAIYTEEAGGGEPPVISISVNTYIQTAGFIALLGTCFSSIKYGVLVGWL